MARLQRVNPTPVSGNPETSPNVTTPPERSAIHGKDRSLAAGRTARRVGYAVRVRGDSPYRIRTLECEETLRDVGLDERYATCFPDECDELEDIEISDSLSE